MPYFFGTLALLLGLAIPGIAIAEISSERVQRETLTESVRLDGVIEAVTESTVSAQTSGTVLRLPFDVDDSVKAGELIVKLEDSEQRARLNQAQGNLQVAQVDYRDARQHFERIEEVYERGYVSQQEYDQAQNRLAAAEARRDRARAAVDEARKQIDYTTVIAPYSGILTERHVEVGESVNPGQPLLSGVSLEELRVVVGLPQKYVESVRARRRTLVTVDDGRVLRTGEMTFYPYADEQTHTFRLRLALEEPEASLYPGMLVKVEAPVAEREALWISAGSLIRRSELRAVYVLDQQDRPRLRQVRVGLRRADRIEVLAGLDAGERVVTNPRELPGSRGISSGAERASTPQESRQ